MILLMLVGWFAAVNCSSTNDTTTVDIDAQGMPNAAQATAMFVFGDSLVDSGNNNFLNSIARSNYYPYGIDSPRGPTGKFSNGNTFVDYLGMPIRYIAIVLHTVFRY